MFRVAWVGGSIFKIKESGVGYFFKYSEIEGDKLLEYVVSTFCCRFADILNTISLKYR